MGKSSSKEAPAGGVGGEGGGGGADEDTLERPTPEVVNEAVSSVIRLTDDQQPQPRTQKGLDQHDLKLNIRDDVQPVDEGLKSVWNVDSGPEEEQMEREKTYGEVIRGEEEQILLPVNKNGLEIQGSAQTGFSQGENVHIMLPSENRHKENFRPEDCSIDKLDNAEEMFGNGNHMETTGLSNNLIQGPMKREHREDKDLSSEKSLDEGFDEGNHDGGGTHHGTINPAPAINDEEQLISEVSCMHPEKPSPGNKTEDESNPESYGAVPYQDRNDIESKPDGMDKDNLPEVYSGGISAGDQVKSGLDEEIGIIEDVKHSGVSEGRRDSDMEETQSDKEENYSGKVNEGEEPNTTHFEEVNLSAECNTPAAPLKEVETEGSVIDGNGQKVGEKEPIMISHFKEFLSMFKIGKKRKGIVHKLGEDAANGKAEDSSDSENGGPKADGIEAGINGDKKLQSTERGDYPQIGLFPNEDELGSEERAFRTLGGMMVHSGLLRQQENSSESLSFPVSDEVVTCIEERSNGEGFVYKEQTKREVAETAIESGLDASLMDDKSQLIPEKETSESTDLKSTTSEQNNMVEEVVEKNIENGECILEGLADTNMENAEFLGVNQKGHDNIQRNQDSRNVVDEMSSSEISLDVHNDAIIEKEVVAEQHPGSEEEEEEEEGNNKPVGEVMLIKGGGPFRTGEEEEKAEQSRSEELDSLEENVVEIDDHTSVDSLELNSNHDGSNEKDAVIVGGELITDADAGICVKDQKNEYNSGLDPNEYHSDDSMVSDPERKPNDADVILGQKEKLNELNDMVYNGKVTQEGQELEELSKLSLEDQLQENGHQKDARKMPEQGTLGEMEPVSPRENGNVEQRASAYLKVEDNKRGRLSQCHANYVSVEHTEEYVVKDSSPPPFILGADGRPTPERSPSKIDLLSCDDIGSEDVSLSENISPDKDEDLGSTPAVSLEIEIEKDNEPTEEPTDDKLDDIPEDIHSSVIESEERQQVEDKPVNALIPNSSVDNVNGSISNTNENRIDTISILNSQSEEHTENGDLSLEADGVKNKEEREERESVASTDTSSIQRDVSVDSESRLADSESEDITEAVDLSRGASIASTDSDSSSTASRRISQLDDYAPETVVSSQCAEGLLDMSDDLGIIHSDDQEEWNAGKYVDRSASSLEMRQDERGIMLSDDDDEDDVFEADGESESDSGNGNGTAGQTGGKKQLKGMSATPRPKGSRTKKMQSNTKVRFEFSNVRTSWIATKRFSGECVPEMEGLEGSLRESAIKMSKIMKEAEQAHRPDSPDIEGAQAKVTLQAYGLKIGDKVVVGGVKTGVLRFCGPTEFASGIWAGIELDEPAGKNDGGVGGVSYFKCSPKHGIFAPVTKISKPGILVNRTPNFRKAVNYAHVDTSNVKAKVDTVENEEKEKEKENEEKGKVENEEKEKEEKGKEEQKEEKETIDKAEGLNRPRSSRTGGSQPSVEEVLEEGERVLVAGQRRGVIRFSGETDFAPGWWYGIELDRPVGKNDGSVSGKRYFTCKPKYGVFAPPSRIQKLSDLPDAGECLEAVAERQRRLSGGAGSGSHPSLQTSSTPTKPKSGLVRPKSSGSTGMARRSLNLSSSGGEFKLQEGTSVFCNNELGVIRFMGTVDFAEGVWLGVELRTPRGKNDGSVQGRRYFTCKPNHGLLVRPSKVTVRGINGAKLMGNTDISPEAEKKDTSY